MEQTKRRKNRLWIMRLSALGITYLMYVYDAHKKLSLIGCPTVPLVPD